MKPLDWAKIGAVTAIVGTIIAVLAWQLPIPPGGPQPQPTAYTGHIVEWVNGGGQPNTSWLVGSNGERYWIRSTSIYYCLVKAGHTDLRRQPPTVLDDLPDLGKWASCG